MRVWGACRPDVLFVSKQGVQNPKKKCHTARYSSFPSLVELCEEVGPRFATRDVPVCPEGLIGSSLELRTLEPTIEAQQEGHEMSKNRILSRAAIVTTLALAVTASTGAGAFGAGVSGKPLAAEAEAQALRIRLTLPSAAALKATLGKLGVDVSALPVDRPAITLDQVVSLNRGQVSPKETSGYATVVATSLSGLDTTVDKTLSDALTKSVSSRCAGTACTGGDPIAARRVPLTYESHDLGLVELAGASSSTKVGNTKNTTDLVQVRLDLGSLIGSGGELAAVGDGLAAMMTAINENILPVINPVIAQVEGSLPEITDIIQLGTLKPLPDPTKVSLLDLTVLGGNASITPDVVDDQDIIRSLSDAKVVDLGILGDWISIGSVLARAETYASRQLFPKANVPTDPSAAANDSTVATVLREKQRTDLAAMINSLPLYAKSSMKISDMSLGGLLGVNGTALLNYAGITPIVEELRSEVPAGLEAGFNDLLATATLLDKIAGVKIEQIKGGDLVSRAHNSELKTALDKANGDTIASVLAGVGVSYGASARSDRVRITVEPKIPLLQNAKTVPGSSVPQLTDADYVSTGISLTVDLPSAYSAVGQGVVVAGFNAVTGVGTPLVAAFLLLGAALLVRRFALNR